jgi:hypothetical protein
VWSTGAGTGPRSRTSSATASTAPPCASCPADIPRSIRPGCGDALLAAWLHQPTAEMAGEQIVVGHGVRGGKAVIETLRWRLIAASCRLVCRRAAHHPVAARTWPGRRDPRPAAGPSRDVFTTGHPAPARHSETRTRHDTRAPSLPADPEHTLKSILAREDQLAALLADSGRRTPINFCNRSRLAFSTGKWTKTVKAAS